ncbi:cytochrome c oxidase assembly protein [Salibacterium salarium]|uniref:Cytochrome c oxidase assembly protein n=1 Tax=Salibacterium salarium TaxID=284579 RepID=A0A428N5A5_9BACI|nr:cytochrome c oxidase assembly protein [Salibacterium salarium]RSL33673.1 cytochrome c oxidase assembly protein [Salibacterium salarium]
MSHDTVGWVPQFLLALPFLLALIGYLLFVMVSNRRHKAWPFYRTASWIFGVSFAVLSVAGPLAHQAHMNFTAHMLGHLFLGMLSPLLMVLAAPMTLVLRTLRVSAARRLSRLLRSWPASILTHPITASFLNIGGLWLLYTTDLYSLMHDNLLLHLAVHGHVFLAGYLFTIAMIYIDPVPHRISFLYRAIVLILALAGHGILSKYIYAHPPNGVPLGQAETGGLLMYYGGDAIDVIIIFILCLQWFRVARPRTGVLASW